MTACNCLQRTLRRQLWRAQRTQRRALAPSTTAGTDDGLNVYNGNNLSDGRRGFRENDSVEVKLNDGVWYAARLHAFDEGTRKWTVTYSKDNSTEQVRVTRV